MARAFGVGPGPARRGAVIRSHLVTAQRERDPATTLNDADWLARGPLDGGQCPVGAAGGFRCAGRGGEPALGGVLRGSAGVRGGGAGLGGAAELQERRRGGWFEELAAEADRADVGGEWINRPWDLVTRTPAYLERGLRQGGDSPGVTTGT